MIKVAVVRSGYWGKNLVRNFNELGALHTICDSNPETLSCFQEKNPDKNFQTSKEEVLHSPDINAVVIATPAETHFHLAKSALQAGKHVFVEKPLALIVRETQILKELAMSENLKLMVGHILLYHHAVIKMKKIISLPSLKMPPIVRCMKSNISKIKTALGMLMIGR